MKLGTGGAFPPGELKDFYRHLNPPRAWLCTAMPQPTDILRDYTEEGLRDPAVLAMADRVGYRVDPDAALPIGGQSALSRPAVEIRTRDGRILHCTPEGVPGDPAHPVGWDLLEAKFRDCVSFAHRPLVQGGADRMIELVRNLDCLDDITEIIHLFG